jgi:uncharacterized protein YggL (DUF469 family)
MRFVTASEQVQKEWEGSTVPATKTVERRQYKKWTETHEFRRFGEALAWLFWNPDFIAIRKLQTLNCGNGGPARLLKYLQTIADKHGLRIFARISAYLPDQPAPKCKFLNQQELEAWYARRGFKIVPTKCGTDGWYPTTPKE